LSSLQGGLITLSITQATPPFPELAPQPTDRFGSESAIRGRPVPGRNFKMVGIASVQWRAPRNSIPAVFADPTPVPGRQSFHGDAIQPVEIANKRSISMIRQLSISAPDVKQPGHHRALFRRHL